MNNNLKKAIESQKRVSDLLKSKGFEVAEVSHPFKNGVDIVAIKDNQHFSIEVKTPIYSSRAWKVNKPCKKSDYVALVLPSGDIHVEAMQDWEKLSRSGGVRTITKLVQFYEKF